MQIERFLSHYGFTPVTVHPRQMGYRNHSYPVRLAGGETVNLILYKTEPGILAKIKDANAVAAILHDQHFPVRTLYDPRILQLKAGDKTKYGALYTYLPGETILWEGYSKNHLKLLGLTMARMHHTLAGHAAKHSRVTDVYQPIFDRMDRYFNRPEVQTAIYEKLGLTTPDVSRFRQLIRNSHSFPRQQLLHMDFVRSNLLFGPPKTGPLTLGNVSLTGIIDFEKTAYGHPAYDIARTLAFLLVDCKHKSETKIIKYFLHSGYNKRGPATFNELPLLTELTNLFLLHDFYKFLVHNPYDFLEANEHFLRTRDILASRGLIRYDRRNANAVTE